MCRGARSGKKNAHPALRRETSETEFGGFAEMDTEGEGILGEGELYAAVRELLASFMRTFAQRPENRRLHIYTDCDRMD